MFKALLIVESMTKYQEDIISTLLLHHSRLLASPPEGKRRRFQSDKHDRLINCKNRMLCVIFSNKGGLSLKFLPSLTSLTMAQVQHELRLRKRTQNVIGVAVEAYLRSDLRCGSQDCETCPAKTLGLPAQATHYVIPDSQALEDFLDVFELPDFTGFIILTSVLRKVTAPGASKGQVKWCCSTDLKCT